MADSPRQRRRSSAVLGLLSEEGRSKGRLVDGEAAVPQQSEADPGDDTPIELAPVKVPESEPVSAPAPVTSSSEARQPPKQAMTKTASGKEQPVSQTVRVTGVAAKTLRDAWLEERRQGDVLLSYTDFATRVVMAGLDAIKNESR